jgi:hypothetical protein
VPVVLVMLEVLEALVVDDTDEELVELLLVVLETVVDIGVEVCE